LTSDKTGTSGAQLQITPALFFTLASVAVAGGVAIVLRHVPPIEIVLVVVTVGAAGVGAAALYRTLQPLVDSGDLRTPVLLGGRTRAALERDKALTLRAIKELEFDHAMGKLSDSDFAEMQRRLRERALRLMAQLEGGSAYRERIEREVRARMSALGAPEGLRTPASCIGCGTVNDADARFCKMCGHALQH